MDKSSGNVGKSSEGRKLGRWRNFFARPKCFRIMFNDTVRDARFFFLENRQNSKESSRTFLFSISNVVKRDDSWVWCGSLVADE